jgi:hypothetical protein
VGCLQQSHQQRGPNRTDGGNLAQSLHRWVLVALAQKFAARLQTYRL